MESTQYTFTLQTMLVLSLVMLLSCASPVNNVNRIAQKQYTVSLSDPLSKTGKWESNDIVIHYDLEEKKKSFTLSGSLLFKGNIKLSFPIVESFKLYITYLDKDGKGLATHKISPFLRYRKPLPENIELPQIPAAPAGADGFTFSYWGFFRATLSEGSASDWEIYLNPFE